MIFLLYKDEYILGYTKSEKKALKWAIEGSGRRIDLSYEMFTGKDGINRASDTLIITSNKD